MERTPLRGGLVSVGAVLVLSLVLSATAAASTSSSRSSTMQRPASPTPGSHFAAPSFGSAPTVHLNRRLPVSYDPLSSLRVSNLPGDREVDGVRAGPTSLFRALGNTLGIGDCTVVAAANVVAAVDLRRNVTAVSPTTAQAVETWHELNADTPGGISDATLLDAWLSPWGLFGTRVAGWTSLDITSRRAIESALMATGGLYARLTISDALPWAALVWSQVPATTAAVEGHAVALVGWTRVGWIAVSWGEVVLIPWAYWAAEGASAYAVSLRLS